MPTLVAPIYFTFARPSSALYLRVELYFSFNRIVINDQHHEVSATVQATTVGDSQQRCYEAQSARARPLMRSFFSVYIVVCKSATS